MKDGAMFTTMSNYQKGKGSN